MSALPAAIIIGAALASGWAIASVVATRRQASGGVGEARAREALVEFSEHSLELETTHDLLTFAGKASLAIFGSERTVAFQPGEESGEWEAWGPAGDTLQPVPAHLRSVFAWFRHNNLIAVASDLGKARFGAMREPLKQLFGRYGLDVLLPLIKGDDVLGVLGLSLGRNPSPLERELMYVFQLQATAAYANVLLHHEAAHIVSLAEEVDLASSVELALVPAASEGTRGAVSWAGHFESAGEGGSDFWSAYELEDGRVAFVIGDALAGGLGGSMISAVVKSCADVIFENAPADLNPGTLMSMLSRALRLRAERGGQTRCFAAFVDPAASEITFANAGQPAPYVVEHGEGEAKLGALARPGLLLGDTDGPDVAYEVVRRPLSPGAAVVLCTDGLTSTGADARTGERRLQRLLRTSRATSAPELRDAIVTEMREHRAGTPARDDAALVVLRLAKDAAE